MILTPAAAITDPVLLGPYFAGSSWATWHAILKAAYAEPLNDAELALFRGVAGDRDPPRRRVKELVVIGGRRSGKDSIASALATVAATEDYSAQLRPGERAVVMCLAVDREQAKIVHRYIAGYFHALPLLQPLVVRALDDGLELANGVDIVVATNSYRSVRGRTIACAIFDEAAFWRSEESANPDSETYAAIRPGMVTLPSAILVIITTAYRKAGLAYNKFARSFGQNDDNVLVIYGPSTAFNPTLPQQIIDDAMRDDPEAAGAEWLSIWRSDISDFLDRELVDAALDRGVNVRPPRAAIQYVAFVDPSGGRGDSFTLAISHVEGELIFVDLLHEHRAPFDPSVVVHEIADILRSYGVAEVVGDNYAAGWTVEGFAREGILYTVSERNRSAIYIDSLPIFTSGRARLPENHRAENQLVSLERRTSRSGRDSVNHPPGGADDLANAICGALVLAATAAAPSLWRSPDLRVGGAPIPWPVRCIRILATAAADQRGVALCYWALHSSRYPIYPDGKFTRNPPFGPRTLLIDYDLAPLTPALFPAIAERLAKLAAAPILVPIGQRRIISAAADQNPLLIATRELFPHATAAGLDVAADATALLEASRPALLLAAAAAIGTGEVKISSLAEATTARLPLPLAAIRPDGAEPTAAADAALLGIAASLPAESQPREWRGLTFAA
jgi:hypothetical protein